MNISYNSANQMLTFNDKSMTYDENGNLTSITNSCGTTTYTWDARNRLVAINGFTPALASASTCEALAANFKYDAFGRRIEKTVNGKTIQYLYDGVDIVEEIENGTISATYLRTLNIDEPLARLTPNASRLYQLDALGSVITLTDETGSIKTQYTYDPFGKVTVYGESSDNPFQYTGRENDGTGFYYYRARYYSPQLQRFISEDPIGLLGGINLYSYVANDPVNKVDARGEYIGLPIIIGIGIGVGAVAITGYALWKWYSSPGYQKALKLKDACEKDNLSDEEFLRAYEDYKDSLRLPLKQGELIIDLLNETKPWEAAGPSPKGASPKVPPRKGPSPKIPSSTRKE